MDTMDLIGKIIVFLTIIINFMIAILNYKSIKENNKKDANANKHKHP